MRYSVAFIEDASGKASYAGISGSLLVTIRHILRLKREGAYEIFLRIEV
jgi:hypothetical protein